MKTMIIVKLQGGLGNQMFQYAAGYALALRKNVPLKLDVSYYDSQDLRQYLLGNLNIQAEIAAQEDLQKYKGKLFHFFEKTRPITARKYIKENKFAFNAEFLELGDDVYLDGYWQSEKYFKDIEKIIRQEFTLKESIKNDEVSLLMLKIRGVESISLHVRRSDYVTDQKVNAIHGQTSLDYYEQAITYIKERTQKPQLFIFSDDIAWVQEHLKTDVPMIFIPLTIKDYEAQHLMSLCRHNILANSTYSWWAAWLNANPQKIVIAPKKWFNDNSRDTNDLIPENWITL